MAFRVPVSGTLVEDYGYYGDIDEARFHNGTLFQPLFHYGIDFSALAGTDVRSLADGKVVFASNASQEYGNGYGYTAIIQHKDGDGVLIDRYSVYSHLFAPPLVSAGDSVAGGQHIGDVGSSGGNYGNHLHLSVLGGLQSAGLLNSQGVLSQATNIFTTVRDYALQLGTFSADFGVPTYQAGNPPLYGNIINPGNLVGDIRGPSNDWFLPVNGNDYIDGLTGTDTVEYQEGIEQIWFYRADHNTAIAIAVNSDGSIQGDILENIERIADDGAKNIIEIGAAPLQTLLVGSTSSSDRFEIPTQDYENVEIDGGGGDDTIVAWGDREDWTLIDVSGPEYWLTANSTPATAEFLETSEVSDLPNQYTIQISDVENIEFDDGVYSVESLLDGVIGPDLTVGAIGLNAQAASPGSDIEVSFQVANAGSQAVGPTRGEIIVSSSSDFGGAIHVLDDFVIPELDAAGGQFSSKQYVQNVTLPVTLGRTDYYVGVRVDTDEVIAEANEGNNIASSSALAVGGGLSGDPDLRVVFDRFPDGLVLADGDTVPVEFEMRAGADGFVPYTYRIYFSADDKIDSDDTILFEDTTSSGLGYLGRHSYSIDLSAPSNADYGVGYFIVQADPYDAVSESREDNNVRSDALVYSPDAPDSDTLPDLFAQNVHFRDADTRDTLTTLYAGERFNYATDFGNLSPDDAVPDLRREDGVTVFENALIFSEDQIISADDRIIHLNNWNAFEPGEFRTTNSSVTMTLPSDLETGTYFAAVVTDFFDEVAEETNSNNVSAIQQINVVNDIPPSIVTMDDVVRLINTPTAVGNVLDNDTYQLFSNPLVDRVNGLAADVGSSQLLPSGLSFQLNSDGSFSLDATTVMTAMAIGSEVTEQVSYRAVGVNQDVSTSNLMVVLSRVDRNRPIVTAAVGS